MNPLATLLLLLFLLLLLHSFAADPLTGCNLSFSCGSLSNLSYPFTGAARPSHCGPPPFHLTCEEDDIPLLTASNSLTYRVLHHDPPTQTMRLARSDLFDTMCTQRFVNTSFDPSFLSVVPAQETLSLFYGCKESATFSRAETIFSCATNGAASNNDSFFLFGPVPSITTPFDIHCSTSVNVPILITWSHQVAAKRSLLEVLRYGFNVSYSNPYAPNCDVCAKSGGQCGFDAELGKPTCICGDRLCPEDKSKAPLGIGLGIAGLAVIGGLVGGCFVIIKRKRKSLQAQSKGFQAPPSSKGLLTASTGFSSTTPSYPSSRTTDLEKGSAYFGVTMFTYIELEEATNNFDSANQLGDGGFGVVYYGLLKDGRNVAVKRLYENNVKRAEQFMNEIEILTRLRHKNLVTLYGCTSRRSQELLLVYEYIANGTVADHVHGKHSNSGLLTWPVRLSIAIETADALAFLHASDVIHRDVKTNNILLCTNFQVKVADFGLSRLFPNDVTHVSTAPQGTPGYVDPEYYQCYQLTDKSDVYSFGVVLVELISSLQAVDTNRHRHDINLSNMAVNKIQNHELQELVDPSLGFDSDYAVKTMITSVAGVAFRCLQQEREMRPKMEEVLKDLRRIESEYYGAGKAEVVDIREDAGLLKNVPPPLSFSPDSITDKWATGSPKTTPISF